MMPLHSNNTDTITINTPAEGGDYCVTDYTYSLDDITIDFNDVYTIDTSMLTDNISITDNTNFGPISTSFYDGNISNGMPSMYENLCEYIGIDTDVLPEDLDKMCDRYPSLKKALEQFKNTYNLVKDDWRNDND
jgi:hypothetical protein